MRLDILRSLCIPLILSVAAPACTDDGDPDESPYAPDDVCAMEGRYDDGTCDATCPNRDIDCFVIFDDHAAANAWFADFEVVLAAEQLREPRAVVSEDDPRFVRMREMLDQGWEAYRAIAPVGALKDPPELVLVQDPAINAFALADLDTGKSGFVVVVQTGLLDAGIEDHELLGVVMHELEHAVGLHTVPGGKDRVRKHYQVLGTEEPFGFEQPNNELAQEVITLWRIFADEAGPYTLDALADVPVGETTLQRVLQQAHAAGRQNDAAACARADEAKSALDAFIRARRSAFDLELDITGEEQQAADLASAYFTALRDECLAGTSLTIYDVYAALAGITPEAVEQSFTAEDKQLVAGKHVVDAIRALTADRYQTMQLIEGALIEETGGDLSTLRYYSYEEAADDRSVEVLEAMGLPPDGNGSFLLRSMKPEDQQRCSAILDAGQVPPYGNLFDEHHGTCFRVFHTRALAARGTTQRARSVPQPVRDPAAVQDTLEMVRAIRSGHRPFHLPSVSDRIASCAHGH
jgi:hypothetical protein